MTETLLPANATALERALATVAARVSGVPVPIGDFWSPERCPAALLPWLAWALAVDHWDPDWPEEVRRHVIAASIDVNRRAGTVWAMRRALEAAGLGDADIQEGWSAIRHDGAIAYDGSHTYAPSDHWAEYRVVLGRPLSIAQAERARAILISAAPARSRLKVMDFAQAANLYNGAISYDGSYTYGTI